MNIFPSKSIVSFIIVYKIAKQICFVHAVFQHLLEAVLHSCNIFMAGHTIPSIVGFQDFHRHLSLFQQLTDENRNQIPLLCSCYFYRTYFDALVATNTFTFIYLRILKDFFILYHRYSFFRTDGITG